MGHPKIFLDMGDLNEIRCPYCSKLFVFEKRESHRFWMKDMQFPLDIIWLDNHRIVHIIHNAQPANTKEKLNVMTSPLPVNFLLEIAGGRSTKHQLKLGQRMKFKF